jgi:four helix bundle protein
MEHKKLEVWNEARKLTSLIYILSETFPKSEKFGLISQVQRSVVSIPSNIAEGAARNSDKEFVHHLYFALGSLAELETQLILAQDLSYVNNIEPEIKQLTSVKRLILGLIRFLKSKP